MKHFATIAMTAAALSFATQASAQDSTFQSMNDEIGAMLTAPKTADVDRAEIRDFLDRADVSATAETYGIDLDRVRDRVGTLEADDAADLSNRIREAQDEPAQVGGDRLVISATALTLILLVVILVVVA